MSDSISPEIFAHLVDLAALELSDAEAEYLREQLNHQLKAIHELEAIPLEDDTPVTSHGVPYTAQISQPPRADVWQPSPDVERILTQAPEIDDGYIVVPDIPHTTLPESRQDSVTVVEDEAGFECHWY
jgi:aspartyl/glutamyl-tRNA(Asn/Gln) amidotransferase C subunit